MNFDEFDALIHQIYDAALHPERWSRVLAAIAKACRASRSLLYTPHHTPDQGGFLFPFNISQADIDHWARWGHVEDPLVKVATERGLIARGEGVAMNGEDLMPLAELRQTEFYRRLWEPMDVARVASGMVFDGTDSRKLPTILAVYRPLHAPSFTDVEILLIRRLLAHVSRSLGVMFHLRDNRLQVASSLAALDRLRGAVFLLAPDKNVQFVNAAGRDMLQGEPFVLKPAGEDGGLGRLALAPRLARWERQFARCLSSAVSEATLADPHHFSAATVLPNASGQPTFVLNAAPLGDTPFMGDDHHRPRGVVIAYNLSKAVSLSLDKLVTTFDFTQAEARAAIEVMHGGTTGDMARRLGVSINTLKTQLKAVYAKSCANRHADLLKLLLALAEAPSP